MRNRALGCVLVLGLVGGFASTPALGDRRTASTLDRLASAQFRILGVPPSPVCADAVYLRRVYLDAIGTLPTPEETKAFLADSRPDKRTRLVATLLARPEWADRWGLKWGDLLRVKSEFPSNLWPNAVQAYDHWIRDALARGMPYNQFVRELLTASGSNFRDPAVNFYRAFQDRSPGPVARNVAQVFLGLRLDQAGFSPEEIRGFEAFFAKVATKPTGEWKEEIVTFNPKGRLVDPVTHKPIQPRPLGARPLTLPEEADPRAALADWVTSTRNPWFAKAYVNRVWYWLLGRGLVQEPDDFRPGNPAWNEALLDLLAKDFVRSGFDMKAPFRAILDSQTYQLSSTPPSGGLRDDRGFARYRLRRLDAEVLLDAINQALGTGEQYSSPIPEPYTFLPPDQRAIRLADGSIESPFLERFGRPPRNTSFESERSDAVSALQAQHLLNATHIQAKLAQSPALKDLLRSTKQATDTLPLPPLERSRARAARVTEELYLRFLSRYPGPEEAAVAADYLMRHDPNPGDAVQDLAWALINTLEFQVRH